MENVKEELIPKGKILKSQSGWIEYFFDKKGKINKITIYDRDNYVTIKMRKSKSAISVDIQFLARKLAFYSTLSNGVLPDKIRSSEIFYRDFLETYIVENGFSEFVKYVIKHIKDWINEIFYPF